MSAKRMYTESRRRPAVSGKPRAAVSPRALAPSVWTARLRAGTDRILILHVSACDGDVVEAVRRLHAGRPKVKLLTVAGACNREMIAALLGVGVSGCLYTDWYAAELPAALRAMRSRKKFVSWNFLKKKESSRDPVRKPRANSDTRRLR